MKKKIIAIAMMSILLLTGLSALSVAGMEAKNTNVITKTSGGTFIVEVLNYLGNKMINPIDVKGVATVDIIHIDVETGRETEYPDPGAEHPSGYYGSEIHCFKNMPAGTLIIKATFRGVDKEKEVDFNGRWESTTISFHLVKSKSRTINLPVFVNILENLINRLAFVK
jgi:hypothetical protein